MRLALIALASALAFVPLAANAAGCVSGAAVGALAGHVAGHHAVLGAAGGCLAGHEINKHDQNAAQQQQINAQHQANQPASANAKGN
jgi:uncharacterized protein YcfJ